MSSAAPTISELQQKAARFCAWRDRCSNEVEEKLRQWGASAAQQKKTIQWLEQENYLDNNRFAQSFARGKFSNNQWGRVRIALELKARNMPDETIEKAILQIQEDQYQQTMKKLALKKWNELAQKEPFEKRQKTAAYLLGKGYEMNLVWQTLDEITQQMK